MPCDTQQLTNLHTQNTQNSENHKHNQTVHGMKNGKNIHYYNKI